MWWNCGLRSIQSKNSYGCQIAANLPVCPLVFLIGFLPFSKCQLELELFLKWSGFKYFFSLF